jgi:hypothetical protein
MEEGELRDDQLEGVGSDNEVDGGDDEIGGGK